jgi:hypothetical protein
MHKDCVNAGGRGALGVASQSAVGWGAAGATRIGITRHELTCANAQLGRDDLYAAIRRFASGRALLTRFLRPPGQSRQIFYFSPPRLQSCSTLVACDNKNLSQILTRQNDDATCTDDSGLAQLFIHATLYRNRTT